MVSLAEALKRRGGRGRGGRLFGHEAQMGVMQSILISVRVSKDESGEARLAEAYGTEYL
jgi:hypothetical protein